MLEETVTAAPDLSAVESALIAIESQLAEAESIRASEREQESSSISESLFVRADEEAYYRNSTETLVIMTIFLSVALGVVCGLLAVIANKR